MDGPSVANADSVTRRLRLPGVHTDRVVSPRAVSQSKEKAPLIRKGHSRPPHVMEPGSGRTGKGPVGEVDRPTQVPPENCTVSLPSVMRAEPSMLAWTTRLSCRGLSPSGLRTSSFGGAPKGRRTCAVTLPRRVLGRAAAAARSRACQMGVRITGMSGSRRSGAPASARASGNSRGAAVTCGASRSSCSTALPLPMSTAQAVGEPRRRTLSTAALRHHRFRLTSSSLTRGIAAFRPSAAIQSR